MKQEGSEESTGQNENQDGDVEMKEAKDENADDHSDVKMDVEESEEREQPGDGDDGMMGDFGRW